MATDIQTAQTELQAFHWFLGERLASGRCNFTVEESVELFREYQREVERLRKELKPALEQSSRGESGPLDIDELKEEVTESLAENGIRE